VARLAHLGRMDEARAAKDQLLRILPHESLGLMRTVLPWDNADFMERFVDGLRKASVQVTESMGPICGKKHLVPPRAKNSRFFLPHVGQQSLGSGAALQCDDCRRSHHANSDRTQSMPSRPYTGNFRGSAFARCAVAAHAMGQRAIADALIRLADIPAITEWTESLWGKGGPWSRPLDVDDPLPFLPKEERVKSRMPTQAEKIALLSRDGFHCRFCGIPVVRAETRSLIRKEYPDALRWGDRNSDQHAGFQALWLQFDHLLPHARGGTNDLDNIVVTCAPCNNGRSNLTLDEVGLVDPRSRVSIRSIWDGLERFRGH
jgi:5-methylcytosine-specific restriction endonuclease McrA